MLAEIDYTTFYYEKIVSAASLEIKNSTLAFVSVTIFFLMMMLLDFVNEL